MSEELRWGETPWDKLPREELLREVQRMYAAVLSLNSALTLCRAGKTGGFWSLPSESEGHGGTGGCALEKARMILEPLHAEWSSEDIYRAFFRYAVDLLFTPALGFGWSACDGCKDLYGTSPDQESMVGKPCENCQREGRHFLRRPLEWRDLKAVE